MRKDEFITFRRISLDEGNKDFSVNRKELIERMEEIKSRYKENNEFAKKFVKLLPDTLIVTIDVDRNRNLDHPIVICATLDDRPAELVKIPRRNEKIWEILNECISDEFIKD